MSSVAVKLPPPQLTGNLSLEHCLSHRRSCRLFEPAPLPLTSAAQLLWAAQGVTGLGGLRCAPSAGAAYPFRLYAVAMNVERLAPGAYQYDPDLHALSLSRKGDLRAQLLPGVMDQAEIADAAMAIVLAANFARMQREFGESGARLAHIEAGHIAQNILLQAVSLEVGAIGLGRIDETVCAAVLDLPKQERPVYVVLAGVKSLT